MLVGGADTFTFLTIDHGYDSIADFEQGKDHIDVTAAGLTFDMIDSNDNMVLDDGDFGVRILSGMTTQISFTDVVNGTGTFSADLLTVTGIDALIADDFAVAIA